MRNVTELSKLNGKVYVYLKDEVIARRFLQDAENEGIVLVLRDPDIGAGCREANHLSEIFDSCSNSDHDNTSSCVLCDGSFSGTFMPASRIIVSKLCSITCRVFCCFWRSCFSFLAKASSSSSSSC